MIKPITDNDIWKIQKVAHSTWPFAFKEILQEKQLYYMLDLMYSSISLYKQLSDGHLFYSYEEDGIIMGFIGIKLYENHLKIHKIYIIPDYQGKSIGKALMNYALNIARNSRLQFITLNVNRHNPAVFFYEHLGFSKELIEDIEIGNGYLMEDYRMTMYL